MKKKLFFGMGLILFLLLIFLLAFFTKNSTENSASLFQETVFDNTVSVVSSDDWRNAISHNDLSFFSQNIDSKNLPILRTFLNQYPLKTSVEVFSFPHQKWLLSFLGIQKGSTKLNDNNYAYLGNDFIFVSPKATFSQDISNKNIYINTSSFPFPLDGEYLSVSNQKEIDVKFVSLSPSEKTFIDPQEKFMIKGRENISSPLQFESLKYGFIISGK